MLKGNCGDAQRIVNNFGDFSILNTLPEFDTLAFNIVYKGQKGTINIMVDGNRITDVTLNLEGFPKALGSHNDEKLFVLAKEILNSLK